MSSNSDNSSSSDDEDYIPDIKGEGSDHEDADVAEEDKYTEPEKVSKEEVDKIWNDFKADVTKEKQDSSKVNNEVANSDPAIKNDTTTSHKSSILTKEKPSTIEKNTITVTKVYDFAGESVKITKEVEKSSKEAQYHLNSTSAGPSIGSSHFNGSKRRGGLHGILGKMEKRPKLSTLEKSKLDWKNYKQEEGIEDELKIHNKGKDGYVEKQLFLERTDYRQFEKERDVRLGRMSKR